MISGNRKELRISPMLYAGAGLIIFLLIAYMTVDNIYRQKRISKNALIEKGETVIRSFEAAVRFGMMSRELDKPLLYSLLEETSKNSDVGYIKISDMDGYILAGNNTADIGKKLSPVYHQSQNLDNTQPNSRITTDKKGNKFLEVYRFFSSHGTNMRGGKGSGMGGQMHGGQGRQNQCRAIIQKLLIGGPENTLTNPILYIHIGIPIKSFGIIDTNEIKRVIGISIILLITGLFGVVGIFTFHNMKQTKTILSEVKAFSDTLVENMPAGLVFVSDKHYITAVNDSAGRILNINPDNIINHPIEKTLMCDIWKEVSERISYAESHEKEFIYQNIETDDKFLEISTTTLKDKRSMVLGYIILIKDQTELEALRNNIAKNKRLVSIGKLSAGVAHEIRNPLSSIKGFATYFGERYSENPEDVEISEIMIQEVERMDRVIKQLLDFSKPVSLDRRDIHLDSLMKEFLKLESLEKKGREIEIRSHFPDTNVLISADRDKIRQVLLNLWLNSMAAIKKKGKIDITCNVNQKQNMSVIEFKDNGCGIKSENLSHVFDPYFTTRKTGTGIGLSIVHSIIDAHNGKIEVMSEENKGTTFKIYLPIKTGDINDKS